MTRRFLRLLRDTRAASAAEFALVVPLLLLLLFGIIDIGRFLWTLNQVEKATQMGARYAVVSNPVATVINTDFVGSSSIPGGDPVPASVFGSATCTSTTCSGTGSVGGISGRNGTAFTQIVTWMQNFYPALLAANVTVIYQNVGLGYSGDPTGPDVSPLTTISVSGLTFQPLVLFGASVNLPTVTASLTMEDASCAGADPCGSSN